MSNYTLKRILVIFTGGTIAGNVAESQVSQNVKSDPNSFLAVLQSSVDVVKKNWNIEIEPSIKELLNVDSSNMQPENWTMIIEEIQTSYDEYDAFIRCAPRHQHHGLHGRCPDLWPRKHQ